MLLHLFAPSIILLKKNVLPFQPSGNAISCDQGLHVPNFQKSSFSRWVLENFRIWISPIELKEKKNRHSILVSECIFFRQQFIPSLFSRISTSNWPMTAISAFYTHYYCLKKIFRGFLLSSSLDLMHFTFFVLSRRASSFVEFSISFPWVYNPPSPSAPSVPYLVSILAFMTRGLSFAMDSVI
jgi:hypothetical protein